MSLKSKKEYLESILLRYRSASKKQKSVILNEFCLACGYHRKHAIRILNHYQRFTKPKSKKPGRASRYNNPSILGPLKEIWLKANLPCSSRLKAVITLWLPFYPEVLSAKVKEALLSISQATIDRILKSVRIKYGKRGRSTTKPGTLLKKHIPIKTKQWDEERPGYIEGDTVAHCGGAINGEYAHTVDTVDIATAWTEQRAVLGKGEAGVLNQLKDIEASYPFPLLGFDSDNGGEFINYHAFKYFTQREKPLKFTRSREYESNDNAHIEQKNWTHVRQYLGYDRLDDPRVVDLMNELYRSEWRLYLNFFLPSVKLLSKERIGSTTIKKHDSPKTPYQRVLESKHVKPDVKERLRNQFETLNPFELKKGMEKKLARIFNLVR
jgi:hypothetical protein